MATPLLPPSWAASPQPVTPHLESIEQSHLRCAALGLSRIDAPDFSPLGRSDLNVARERNLRLYSHAAPIMEMLFEQIINTQNMVVLTDAQGTVLHSIGDDDFLERANKVALSPGANWSESSKGTNAVGTALINETPTLVHADEHFMHANNFLTCSAAPILDPRGNILGVLDVSGDHHSYHQHTMGLVKMSARMIENHWLTDDFRNALRLHFHSRSEFIGTLMEGILAVGLDGRVLGANRSALDQLGLSGAALRMHSLTSLLGTSVNALVDQFRSPLATPALLSLSNGRQFHVMARFNWPVWHSLGTQPEQGNDDAARDTGAGLVQAGERLIGVRATPEAAPLAGPAPTGLRYLQSGDPQIETVVSKIRRVLDRDIPILVMGETGTGKELLARAIHQDSARAKHPFVAVNCASIPETLIEAELFGYEEGAFTGARRKGSIGKIVQANGGTLFLDEIGDMPIALQARLLRVLQERQVTPLGSAKSITVDVSIICATHRNLREMINRQQFREDLYYRLNGLVVRMPPLRERTDLLTIVRKILRAECPQRSLDLSREVTALFERYAWPGNVRQLANVLRTAVVMAAHDPQITRDHLSDDFLEDAMACTGAAPKPFDGAGQRRVLAVVVARRDAARRPPGVPRPQSGQSHAGRARAADHPPRRRCGRRQHLASLQATGHQPQHHLPQVALEGSCERVSRRTDRASALTHAPRPGPGFGGQGVSHGVHAHAVPAACHGHQAGIRLQAGQPRAGLHRADRIVLAMHQAQRPFEGSQGSGGAVPGVLARRPPLARVVAVHAPVGHILFAPACRGHGAPAARGGESARRRLGGLESLHPGPQRLQLLAQGKRCVSLRRACEHPVQLPRIRHSEVCGKVRGPDPACPRCEVVLEFLARAQEGAAQEEAGHRPGMLRGIRHRDEGPPGPRGHRPAIEAQVPAQNLNVLNEMRQRVGLHTPPRQAAATASLVHADPTHRLPRPPLQGLRAAAPTRAAVHDQYGQALRITPFTPPHLMPVLQRQMLPLT